MARPDGRIEPGQSLRGAISARAWNRAQDAADLVLGDSLGVSASGPQFSCSYHWIYAKMLADVQYGDAVRLLNFVQTNSESTDTLTDSQLLQGTPVVFGTAITSGTGERYKENLSGVGVAVEPIKSGNIGRVAVSGVLACNVFCRKGWHGHALPAFTGGQARLESCAFGNIDILFYLGSASVDRSGTNDNDVNKSVSALIRLGNTTPSPSIVVDVDPSWGKGQRRLCNVSSTVAIVGKQPIVADKTNIPQQVSTAGGSIYVLNIFVNITQAGTGLCVPYGDEWLLVNWTPAEVEIDGDSYWVATYI